MQSICCTLMIHYEQIKSSWYCTTGSLSTVVRAFTDSMLAETGVAYVNWCTPQYSVVSGSNILENSHTVSKLHRLHISTSQIRWYHALVIRSDHKLLTELALPMDLLLTVGPLANVEIEGRRVPPKAISTSFGGCLKLNRKHRKSLCAQWEGVIREPRSAVC